MRHAPLALSPQVQRRLGKDLKPPSQRASNECHVSELHRHVSELQFSKVCDFGFSGYKVPKVHYSVDDAPQDIQPHPKMTLEVRGIVGARARSVF